MHLSSLIASLRQHCREHYPFKQLADELQWSRAELASFFQNDNPTLDSMIKVTHAMGLTFEFKVHPRQESSDIPLIGA